MKLICTDDATIWPRLYVCRPCGTDGKSISVLEVSQSDLRIRDKPGRGGEVERSASFRCPVCLKEIGVYYSELSDVEWGELLASGD